jgi:hypothetical protein
MDILRICVAIIGVAAICYVFYRILTALGSTETDWPKVLKSITPACAVFLVIFVVGKLTQTTPVVIPPSPKASVVVASPPDSESQRAFECRVAQKVFRDAKAKSDYMQVGFASSNVKKWCDGGAQWISAQ